MSDHENAKKIVEVADKVRKIRKEVTELLREDEKAATLRDRFAMAALQGLLAGRPNAQSEVYPNEQIAAVAYGIADAMIEAREQSSGA